MRSQETPVLPLKISEKSNPKESLPHFRSLHKRISKGGIVTNSGSEETQSEINTQLAKINNDTENKRDEPSSKNVNSDIKIRTIDLRFSLTEDLQKKSIHKIIAIARAKMKAFPRNPTSIKPNKHTILTQTT